MSANKIIKVMFEQNKKLPNKKQLFEMRYSK